MRMRRFSYFLVSIFLGIFFSACGDSESKSSKESFTESKYLSISRAPANDGVSIFQNISLVFSADLNGSSVKSSSAYILDANGSVCGSEVAVDELDSSIVIFTPHKYFSPDSNYTIVITTAIKDLLGRSLSEDFHHTFSTESTEIETANLFVKATKPSNANMAIDPSSDFYIEFNRFVSQGNVLDNAILELKDSTGKQVEGVAKVFNSTLSFIPSSDLNYTQDYTLSLMHNVSDMFGNIYRTDQNLSSWHFRTTNEENSYKKSGFGKISEFNTEKSSYIIQTLKETSNYSIVVVGSINGIGLYKINYILPFTKPSITLLYTHELPSKVNTLVTFSGEFILAGTKENGIYSFKVEESGLTQKTHIPLAQTIYGLSLGASVDGTINRAYGVGPKHGLSIYTLSEDGLLQQIKHIDQNNSIMVDVVELEGYDDTLEKMKKRIYVADYNDAMLVYDENGSFEKKVDFNTSIRKVLPIGESNYLMGVAAVSSTGLISSYSLDVTSKIYSDLELPLKVSNAKNYINNYELSAKYFVSDKNRGILLFDPYSSYLKPSLILDPHGIISSSVIRDDKHAINYFMGVSEKGILSLYNTFADSSFPEVISTSVVENGVIEANASIGVVIHDNALDFATLNSASFELLDLNDSQTIGLDVNVSGEYETAYCTLTPQTTLENKNYKLRIKSAIKDIVGNSLNNAMDVEVNFRAQTEPIVLPTLSASLSMSGDLNVSEGLSATYTVTLDKPAVSNLDFDFTITHISTLGSDLDSDSINEYYTIEAGQTSTNITVPIVDDEISDGFDIYSVALAGTSSGGGFESLVIDTTPIETKIFDNERSSLSITNSVADENESYITFRVSMDRTAEEDVTFSYTTQDLNTSSLDYNSVDNLTAVISAGYSGVDLNISLLNDSEKEVLEQFQVIISNASINAVISDDAIGVGSIYDEPILMVSENIQILEDSNISINVLANDNADGELSIVNFYIEGAGGYTAGSEAIEIDVNSTNIGTIYVDDNGSIEYISRGLGFYGEVPSIRYITSLNTEATLNITVQNDGNDAHPDVASPDANITINVLANDEQNVTSVTSATAISESLSAGSAFNLYLDGSETMGEGTDGPVIFTYNNGSFNIRSEDPNEHNITINYTTNTGSSSSATIPLLMYGGQI